MQVVASHSPLAHAPGVSRIFFLTILVVSLIAGSPMLRGPCESGVIEIGRLLHLPSIGATACEHLQGVFGEAEARTILVPGDYETITAALNAASYGDIVQIFHGTFDDVPPYAEIFPLEIPDGVTLMKHPNAPTRPVIRRHFNSAELAIIQIMDTADSTTTVREIVIDGNHTPSVMGIFCYVHSESIGVLNAPLIEDCEVMNCDQGIAPQRTNARINRCFIHDNFSTGIRGRLVASFSLTNSVIYQGQAGAAAQRARGYFADFSLQQQSVCTTFENNCVGDSCDAVVFGRGFPDPSLTKGSEDNASIKLVYPTDEDLIGRINPENPEEGTRYRPDIMAQMLYWLENTNRPDTVDIVGIADGLDYNWPVEPYGPGRVIWWPENPASAENETSARGVFHLSQNHPNPFNPVTEISYIIPAGTTLSSVVISVFDATGKKVATLVDKDEKPGKYAVNWDGTDNKSVPVASGVYFYRLTWNGKSETKRMVLLK